MAVTHSGPTFPSLLHPTKVVCSCGWSVTGIRPASMLAQAWAAHAKA